MVVLAAAHAATTRDDDLGRASSGRADLVSSRPISFDWPRSAPPAMASTVALPPELAAASKPVVRTVMTLVASADFTVASALPA
jgi:hypothetical protein